MPTPAPQAAASAAAPLLTIDGVSCSRGGRMIHRDLHLALGPGESIQLHGANGSGKTTLLRAICGFVSVDAGQILWRGRPRRNDDEAFLAEVSYLGHLCGLKRDLSARENLALTRALRAAGHGLDPATALERAGLGEQLDTPVRRLSAGQSRRVALARLLVAPTPLWLLDEPLTALDPGGKALVEALIGEHTGRGGIVVVATHQPLALAGRSSRVLHLGD